MSFGRGRPRYTGCVCTRTAKMVCRPVMVCVLSQREKENIWAHQVITFAGRNGRLQVHLGYPEVFSKVVDTQ